MTASAAKPAPCHHRPTARPSRAALTAAFAKGRERSEAAGLRWTPLRQRALELLLEADGPVKAYDLIANFKADAATAPPTVYRALDALVELRLAHRIPSINAYVACHGEDDGHVASFLICDCCGAVEEIEAPTGELLSAIAAQSAFQAASLTVEAHGRCKTCQA